MTKRLKRILIGLLITAAVFGVIMTGASVAFEIVISQPSGDPAEFSEWNLILVNNSFCIPSNYEITLFELSNGEMVDERIYPELQEMFDEMRSEGIYPFVREGYRTAEEQKAIIREMVKDKLLQGQSLIEAYSQTRKTAAAVGNSEHQLGIAIDINADLDRSSAWEVYDWLDENAYKYGFILRYPPDKTEITQTSYEPWHYRYVGKAAAEEIHTRGLCLEEYVGEML